MAKTKAKTKEMTAQERVDYFRGLIQFTTDVVLLQHYQMQIEKLLREIPID